MLNKTKTNFFFIEYTWLFKLQKNPDAKLHPTLI